MPIHNLPLPHHLSSSPFPISLKDVSFSPIPFAPKPQHTLSKTESHSPMTHSHKRIEHIPRSLYKPPSTPPPHFSPMSLRKAFQDPSTSHPAHL